MPSIKSQSRAIFIFRRDLRLEDNTGLIYALSKFQCVVPCFFLDPRQVKPHPYRSQNAFQFLVESLKDLDSQLRARGSNLFIFHGQADCLIPSISKKLGVLAVIVNRDYTPFSIARDQSIRSACDKSGIEFHSFDDALLNPPESIKKIDNSPYTVFTPFFREAIKHPVSAPARSVEGVFFKDRIDKCISPSGLSSFVKALNPSIAIPGGRSNAKKLLAKISSMKSYGDTHDFPAIKTSNLSAHLKFGTISVREAFFTISSKLGQIHPLIRQLYWRDFFTHVAFHFPKVFGSPFRQRYSSIRWSNDKSSFKAWCDGKTGFPIVDAGMRELNSTGFMHNRVRMIVSSFLVKDLHIDWRLGERYFASKLVDYDPCVNNGNWQWSASTGCDAQPYFRIFNPWLQQKRFDPDCVYIKRWVAQLRNLPPAKIHSLECAGAKSIVPGYPQQIVDHKKESQIAKAVFRSASP